MVPKTILTTILRGKLYRIYSQSSEYGQGQADETVCLIKGKQLRRSVEGIPWPVVRTLCFHFRGTEWILTTKKWDVRASLPLVPSGKPSRTGKKTPPILSLLQMTQRPSSSLPLPSLPSSSSSLNASPTTSWVHLHFIMKDQPVRTAVLLHNFPGLTYPLRLTLKSWELQFQVKSQHFFFFCLWLLSRGSGIKCILKQTKKSLFKKIKQLPCKVVLGRIIINR